MTDKLQEDKPQQTEPPIVKKSAEQTVKKEPTINIEENNFPTLKKVCFYGMNKKENHSPKYKGRLKTKL